MKELVKIQSSPAKFTVDFEKARKTLGAQLKKYDVVVTASTLADAKKLSTELNKQASSIDKTRKDAVYSVSEPIREFDSGMKELAQLCKQGREKILSQVRVFEDKTRGMIEVLLMKLRYELWSSLKVDEKFQSAEIKDLIILTSMTEKGALTGKAKTAIESRVNRDKQQQIEIEMRLLNLENKCYKAGMKSVLCEEHVEAFLYAPEQEYETRLSSLIFVEMKRQKETEAAVLAEAERRVIAQRKAEVVEPEIVSVTHADVPDEAEELTCKGMNVKKEVEKIATESIKSGNVVRVVTAVFTVSVPESVPFERIGGKLSKMIEEAGITSLQSIQVK